MNKLFTLSALVLSTACFYSHTTQVQNPFEQLTPKIEEMANKWIETHVKPFSHSRNQRLMSLLSSQNVTPQDITDAIAAEPSISDALEAIGSSINFFIESYVDNVQKKWAAKKTDNTNQEEFFNQLQQKVMELINYISTIYYAQLYTYMNDSKA